MKRVKKNKIMRFIISSSIMASILHPVSAFADFYDNLDAWKNEGVFTSLTPFASYGWNNQDYSNFATIFEEWSSGMEQSYYRMTAQSDVSTENASQPSFNGKVFEEILANSEFEDYKVGFTYKNQDYRSDYDRYRVDVFAMYASEIPQAKHLYVFGIDEDGQSVVLYIDGIEMLQAGPDFSITQNDELKALFRNFVQTKGHATEYTPPNSAISYEELSAMTSDERQLFCSVTPWYELSNGWCSDAGMTSQAHIDAAYEYGRTYGVDIDTAFKVTADGHYDENTSSNSSSFPNAELEKTKKELAQIPTILDVWGPNLYPDFLTKFDQWAFQLGHSYEPIHYDSSESFNGLSARDVLSQATFEGQTASFLADGQDLADLNSTYIFDVAGMVKSTKPYDEHFYIFTRDREFVPRVLYLSGEKARNGILDLSESENTELNVLFNQLTPQ